MAIDMSKNALDKVGIGLSLLCAIHCILMPLALVASPWFQPLFETHWFHLVMFAIVVPLALFLFIGTYKKHGNSQPLILGGIGIIFLCLGVLVPELLHDHEGNSLWVNSILTTIGGGFVVVAHLKNIKTCRCHHH